jgi:outer membrane protein OmpA-like peptidoglycan-associated protein
VYLSLEGRYMWNRGDKSSDLPFAFTIPAPGVDPSTVSPLNGRADKGWGGKAMLGYRFNNNWDVGVGVSGGWLKGKSKANDYSVDTSFELPFNDGIDVTLDGAVEQSLKVKLNYQVADFEAGYNWTMGGGSNLRLFGGVRYAHFNQKATGNVLAVGTATIDGDSYAGTASASVKRKSTFSGIGPRIGVNGQFGVGTGGFNVFGGLSGSLLYGKFKDSRSVNAQATSIGGSTIGITPFKVKDKSKNKWVPNVEGEIGVGYNFVAGGGSTVGLQVGYRAEKWWGVSSDAPVYGLGGSFGDTTHASDQVFHGPFVRLVATFGAAPAAPPAPPPPAAQPASTKKSFIVFFDFDRSNITAEAQKTINQAAAAAKAGEASQVTLTGHTDRSGSEQYNMALSLRRAEAVKASLIKLGVPASLIVVIGKGESQPLVPTADGVREPQNRRVEIVI